MEGESHTQASTPAGAVFLSYASQDAEAAQRICEALRAGGIKVWFDQSELRGGDGWDRQIRKQIHDCALFVPIVSQHSHERLEGYFRREWRLAVERAGDMADEKAFLVPVAIDTTSERSARVPDPFKHVQWTRLPGGETPSAFVERVRRLLEPQGLSASAATTVVSHGVTAVQTARRLSPRSWRSTPILWVIGGVLVVALAYFVAGRVWIAKHPGPAPATETAASSARAATATASVFNPPPHSIAVLPFVNMSGDKDQEYFSDGLTEEILNSLARINELQVAGRTSSFYFKGEHVDLAAVAQRLNVAAVLEGSVRRSAHTVRITTQLINAVTGFHMWSQTYDRNLGDVLKLQTEIAGAVAEALRGTMLKGDTARVEQGGTSKSAALDAYLLGLKAFYAAESPTDYQAAANFQTAAIRLDPNYALAFAARSIAQANYAAAVIESTKPQGLEDALRARDSTLVSAVADAQRSIELAPELAVGFAARGLAALTNLDFRNADEAVKHALSLDPGNARVLRLFGLVATPLGHIDAAMTTAQKAILLDPLNVLSHYGLADALYYSRRYSDALSALQRADKDPAWQDGLNRGLISYGLGDLQTARVSCERNPEDVLNSVCLALTYEKFGRHADAAAVLGRIQAAHGDAAAYRYADIYAQWGDTGRALQWLDKAVRLRDPDLEYLKMDPLLDPLRNEPRFPAIERALKFPD